MPNATLVSYSISVAYAFEATVFFAVAFLLYRSVFVNKHFNDRYHMLAALTALMALEGAEVALRLWVRGNYIVTGEVQVLGWEYVVMSGLTALAAAVFYIMYRRFEGSHYARK